MDTIIDYARYMQRLVSRYYFMGGIALIIALILMFFSNSDRSIAAIFFNALIISIPFFLGFLFIDYALSITGWHKAMKVFYVLVILAVVLFIPNLPLNPFFTIVNGIIYALLGIFILAVTVSFFIYAFKGGHEVLQADTSHPIHRIANAYQKQKENPKSWEEQISDLFTQKFSDYSNKRGNEEKVNV